MNFSAQEFMFERQRIRQWVPLITQQYRLRHVYQIIGINLGDNGVGRFYYTLHLTTMCAPFYTSEEVTNPNPKWAELNPKDIPNLSASCIALRIWQHSKNGADRILVTWGINFSGLCYIGNKISDIQPYFFKKNTVIFCMQGGFYTSHQVIRTDLQKPIPFLNNINLIDTSNNKVIYKRVAIKACSQDVQHSYSVDKLRYLQQLQMQIRNIEADVQNIRDKINVLNSTATRDKDVSHHSTTLANVRYAPQLLTMNSLNKMLQQKPTYVQKQEMAKISKELEIGKFKIKLLSQERDKKTVIIRTLKQRFMDLLENNEERNSDLMENYHKLSRGSEKLKEYKKNILHHREIYSTIYCQLQQRRRQLLKELLFIFPIEKNSEDKYTIMGITLPNSDLLADSTDSGLSVALGYIAHILIMCSTFLQVPIRYPITHYGSRSYITDNVSPSLSDKERHFPLYTRGKEKIHFTYAVYLLNKNIAQFRWLFYMNTVELKATLYNLLTFLQNPREIKIDASSSSSLKQYEIRPVKKLDIDQVVSLRSFNSISNVSDPLLDCIRLENRLKTSQSPSRIEKKSGGKKCGECGKGLSEILAVPEAYLNKQISSESFRNFMMKGRGLEPNTVCCDSSGAIKITSGKEIPVDSSKQVSIEQGQDPLASTSLPIVRTTDSNLRNELKSCKSYTNNRISRSVGSYSDDDAGLVLKTNFEVGSEPVLNINSKENQEKAENREDRKEIWLESYSGFEETLSRTASYEKSPLTTRTNALRTSTTFNLVKPK
ncbi:UV radiation resistance-associated gene protein [Diorhabda carinulata]|uniref:UV radiation resistance-associated gene protein n=1 Tax=Diorhabda carinulata TaxID=1163345 RepID=UPI0025A1A54A|nr:UV radiation resistance-associated gene protein [Diorhabda carinulata]